MKWFFRFFVVTVCAFTIVTLSSCKQTQKEAPQRVAEIRHVDPDEFEKCIADKDNVILVDMHTQSEYDEGHIEGAMLFDVNAGDFRSEAKRVLLPSKILAVYCRKGKRSDAAGKILVEEGYQVVHLWEGLEAWEKAGKKVVK